eukprot:10232767-Ditylum_brightwellii.AAC.1
MFIKDRRLWSSDSFNHFSTKSGDDIEKGKEESFLVDEPINVEGRGLPNAQTMLQTKDWTDPSDANTLCR